MAFTDRLANRGSISTGPYEIANSIRLDNTRGTGNGPDYMHQPDSKQMGDISTYDSGNGQKWVWSGWLKRGASWAKQGGSGTATDNRQAVMGTWNSARYSWWGFDSVSGNHDAAVFVLKISGTTHEFITNAQYRDYSAWYHFFLKMDTTQATSTDRFQVWINGVRVTSWDAYATITQNATHAHWFADGNRMYYGRYYYSDDELNYNGYLAECIFLHEDTDDGTSTASVVATDFGEFNDNGIWIPKDPSELDFGYRSTWLDFEDASDLGKDVGGRSNHFDNYSLNTYNQTTDTPTNNFCTMNPASAHTSLAPLLEGNLKASYAGGNDTRAFGTMAASSGKWYWEIKGLSPDVDSVQKWAAGVAEEDNHYQYHDKSAGDGPYEVGLYTGNGKVYTNENVVNTFGEVTFAQNDIMMLAMDVDNLKMYWGKNGTWLNSGDPTSGATGTGAIALTASWSPFIPIFAEGNSNSQIWQVNFGNPSFSISSGNADGDGYGNFEYAVPSGFYAWCTKNLAEYG